MIFAKRAWFILLLLLCRCTRYAIGASALLHYGHRLLEDLRLFCVRHMLAYAQGAFMLPMPENRDQFIVRANEYGLE